MPKINTRSRIMITTSLLTFLFLLVQQYDFRTIWPINLSFDPIKPFILSFVAYVLCYWVLHFKVSGERYVTILLFPAITVFALSLLSEILIAGILSEFGQLGLVLLSAVLFWVFVYITFLTVNVLNVSYIREIPLGQAGRASQFILTMIIAYISFFLVFSNDIFLVFREVFILLETFLLVYITLWTIKISKRQRIIASLNIGVLIALLTFILSLWPINSTYIALVLILVFYVCLGIALEIREFISQFIWVEYVSLLVLIFVMLFLLAEWGINGHLL
ncbi:MAG TPA: hypothetical protein PKU78_03725 [Candidatus Dojkabacteria bacterium]|nr:hypothetical protein [Candidatus Dojkabacteria bacterium]HRO65303.1 hypothetical protein [Candidatus Dojkabacteria bacterium]HRP36947.1 hypothetical protein [Candidatus Dojkabacteria bacterium]HRP51595.1 hypothetical protein [Candidatus Dojkabacteria bacterium]